MKFSREVLIGLVAIITLVASIWGYKYLKGENIFTKDKTFHAEYTNIDQLGKSDPVLINGFQVGSVLDIKLNEKNNRTLIVTFSVLSDINIPDGSVANIVPTSVMGGKAIVLRLNGVCSPDECLPPGSFLKGEAKSLLESYIGSDDIDEYMTSLSRNVGQFIDSLDHSIQKSEMRDGFGKTFKELETTIVNLSRATKQINTLAISLNNSLPSVMHNIDGIVRNINEEGESIKETLHNLRAVSNDLKETDIQGIAHNANDVIISSGEAIEALKESSNSLKEVLNNIEEGEGSLGKLMQDESLYNNLNRTTNNLDLLLQDLRLNPKRYINVSVFGKKVKSYTVPEDDPAYDIKVKVED